MANFCSNYIDFSSGVPEMLKKELERLSAVGKGYFFNLTSTRRMENISFSADTLSFVTLLSPRIECFAALCAAFGVERASLCFEELDGGLYGEVLFENNSVYLRKLTNEELARIEEPDESGAVNLEGEYYESRADAAEDLLSQKPFLPCSFGGRTSNNLYATCYAICFNEFARILSPST